MTIQLFANNAKTTLASPINATQTTITVAPGTGALFPNPTTGQAFKVTLVSATSSSTYEICLCTARSGDTLTVVRAQEGTSGTPFVLNDIVGNYDTAGVMADLVQSEQLQARTYTYAAGGGTANALTGTLTSNLTSLSDGFAFTLSSTAPNTGAATLVLTLGSTILSSAPIVKGNNIPLSANDIPGANYPCNFEWNATYGAYVLTNPASGNIVQVVSAVITASTTTTSTSFVNTAVTATITPKYATSKILIMVSASQANYNYTNEMDTQLVRNGSTVVAGSYRIYESFFPQGAGDNTWGSHSIQVVDTPNTTSAVTYTMQVKNQVFNGGYVEYGSNDTNASSIILMEIL